MKKILLAIAVMSIYLNATPKTLNDKYSMKLVTMLEKFTPTCSYYSKTMRAPLHIKQLCQEYDRNLYSTLELGYKLDRNIVSEQHTHLYNGKMHTCTSQSTKETSYNPVLLKAYKTKLLNLDKLRKQIIEIVSREKTKARRSYDVEYHEKLIREDIISLYNSDYTFIGEHTEVYAAANNPRYLKMIEDQREELFSQEQSEYHTPKQKEAEDRQKHTSTPEKTHKSQNNYSDIIMKNCQKKWKTDYRMIEYCSKNQTKAYHSISAFPNNTIMRQCKEKWRTDYRMVKYCYEKQADAKHNLGL